MSTDDSMTSRDRNVLDMLFNPSGELAPGFGKTSPSAVNPSEEEGDEAGAVQNLDPETLGRLRSREADAVQHAEAGELDLALRELSECIRLCPEYASAYNNRAQAYRLKGNNESALHDLNQAISLAKGDRSILKQAYTQRGALHQALGNEDAALADLEKGAKYGNQIASGAAVSLNPYAKLCNAIVAEVMEAELKKGVNTAKAAK